MRERVAYKKGRGRFFRARTAALVRGQRWELTREQYEAEVSLLCVYCRFANEGTHGGLDRLDNSRGYIPGNVVSCCVECNVARGDNFTPDEMRTLIGPAIREVKIARVHAEALVLNAQRHAEFIGGHRSAL